MRLVLRVVVILAIIGLTLTAGLVATIDAALQVLLLGAVFASLGEIVDRLTQLVAETRRQSLLLEDQRASLKRLAEVQAKAWERRTAG